MICNTQYNLDCEKTTMRLDYLHWNQFEENWIDLKGN